MEIYPSSRYALLVSVTANGLLYFALVAAAPFYLWLLCRNPTGALLMSALATAILHHDIESSVNNNLDTVSSGGLCCLIDFTLEIKTPTRNLTSAANSVRAIPKLQDEPNSTFHPNSVNQPRS